MPEPHTRKRDSPSPPSTSDGPYETPADKADGNSCYSVQSINQGAVAWLAPPSWFISRDKKVRPIPAGTTYQQFLRLHGRGRRDRLRTPQMSMSIPKRGDSGRLFIRDIRALGYLRERTVAWSFHDS